MFWLKFSQAIKLQCELQCDMTGIRYNTDAQGHKTEVIIDLKKHGEIVEDILDALLIEERRNEESIPFEEFVEQLKAEGKFDE